MVETSTCVEGCVLTHNDGWVLEHLKHPLKTVNRYRSPMSDHDQMASSGDVVAFYIPIMAMWRATRFYFHFLFLVRTFRFSLSDGMVDGPVQTGPTDMVDDHRAYRPGVLFFLELRVCPTEQWSFVGALSNQLPQVITYHKYASLCGTSSLETGVVLCPHVSGWHQDRKVFIPYL